MQHQRVNKLVFTNVIKFWLYGTAFHFVSLDGLVVILVEITHGNGVTNHQPHDCLLNGLFRRGSKKTYSLGYPLYNVGPCVFSLPFSLVIIERIYILCLIIIIKSEVWTITHCLGLGHETMVYALYVFLYSYQSSASLAFVRRIHRWPVNSPHKGPVTLFPFDDVIMKCGCNFKSVLHKFSWRVDILCTSLAIAKTNTTNPINNHSALVQVMAYCHQTANLYLSQCWPTSMTPSVARPQWKKQTKTGLILSLRPANERRRYKVTPSLIGWAQT